MIRYFKRRWDIFSANLANTFQQEAAYFGNNWGSLASTIFYLAASLIFLDVLYANVNFFAGYSKNEMLFLLFISQINFYAEGSWSRSNLRLLSENVRNGNLDFILTRPIPALFYSTFQRIYFLSFVRDDVPNLIVLLVLIEWKSLNINFSSALCGIAIIILGQIAWHCFNFLFAISVFWHGESKQIFYVAIALRGDDKIPYEGFSKSLKILFLSIIPAIIAGTLSVSVILGKSNGPKMLALSAIVAIIFITLKIYFWKLALKNYTSASS